MGVKAMTAVPNFDSHEEFTIPAHPIGHVCEVSSIASVVDLMARASRMIRRGLFLHFAESKRTFRCHANR